MPRRDSARNQSRIVSLCVLFFSKQISIEIGGGVQLAFNAVDNIQIVIVLMQPLH